MSPSTSSCKQRHPIVEVLHFFLFANDPQLGFESRDHPLSSLAIQPCQESRLSEPSIQPNLQLRRLQQAVGNFCDRIAAHRSRRTPSRVGPDGYPSGLDACGWDLSACLRPDPAGRRKPCDRRHPAPRPRTIRRRNGQAREPGTADPTGRIVELPFVDTQQFGVELPQSHECVQ